ncbi:alpha/beta fold hydrolase [Roseofilum casamattae]|uniref:Alpha/beta fold hydrolase n=1 Tax=Roseofilum casamattae BLCC-M143 TaxID=3022442 RepID=A0ABT7BYA2_9CYAN|nr:alpha/beta fold hydrolase [Roseofilum casamattae]MDJ1184141.1 alpha/beta fold hydrolase [Roseofilum casamattae BLCC-M143]
MQATATTTSTGHYWIWRDRTIYYTQSGTSHANCPPLLLVHGFGASTDHWRKNIEELQEDYQVWAIDLLGFGRSEKADIIYSGDLWRDQLHDFITEVIGEPVILVGNSLGGYASLCVAAQRSQSALGLVLINSAGPFSESEPQPAPNPIKAATGKIARWLFLQPQINWLLFQYTRRRSTIRKTLYKVYCDRAAITDRLVEEIYRPSCDPGAAKVFAAVFKTPSGAKVDHLLEELTLPLLVLWGEGDPWIKARERSPKFHEHYPQLTEHFLQAGHCPHDEVPTQVNQLIRTWLNTF